MLDNKNCLKAISETDDELRVGNYIVLFGGRDLEGIASNKTNADGSIGEYFLPGVEIESSYTKSGHVLVDWEHGYDPDDIGNDQDEILGHLDLKSIRKDEVGIYAERVLSRRASYMQWLEELIKEGLVGNSTEAITKGVSKRDDGGIEKWPLKRDTLTVSPMEPRMLTENSIAAYKALGLDKKLVIPPVQGDSEPKPEAEAAQSAQKAEVQDTSKGESIMEITDEKLQEMIDQSANAAIKAFVAAQPSEQEPEIEVVTDEADNALKGGWKFPGEFFMAVKNAKIRPTEMDKRLLPLKATGANEAIPAEGGFLVDTTISPGIFERMYSQGTVLSQFAADGIGPNSNGMVYNTVDETSRADGSRWGGVRGYWMAEGGTKTASQPKFAQVELKLKKVAALCYATDELLEDSTALGSWLNRTVPDELRFMVEDAILNGNGVGKPLGITQSPALISEPPASAVATAIVAGDIAAMWARRWVGAKDYIWLVDQSILPSLMGLTIGNFPVFMPPNGLQGTPASMLFGRPVFEVEYLNDIATSAANTGLLLCSPSQYALIDKGGVQSASSIHVSFVTDETAFRFVYRVDGAPMWKSALTPFNGGETVSPFVILGSTSS